MDNLFEILGISQLGSVHKNRLIFSLFCLLIAVMLFYFWAISKEKKGAKVKHGEGLIFISFAYSLYFLIGFASIFFTPPPATLYLVISGLISMCFLSSIPFFSLSSHPIDKFVESPYWQNVINLLGVIWLIVLSGADVNGWVNQGDMMITILAMCVMGFFITRYLVRRGLKLLGVVAIIFFLSVILIQVQPPENLVGGKFNHISTFMLGPALALSVVMLSFTFNWINELSFYEIANIWVEEEEKEQDGMDYTQFTFGDHKKDWLKKIAKDDIEKVIEEMIIFKQHKNQKLNLIVSIASRNNRNNNKQLKGIISYENFQLNRNQVSNDLISIINRSK